jgi:hypothetical protein
VGWALAKKEDADHKAKWWAEWLGVRTCVIEVEDRTHLPEKAWYGRKKAPLKGLVY